MIKTISSGYINGYFKGWSLEESLRFVTAAASLKVTRPGLQMFPLPEIQTLDSSLRVERPALIASGS